MTDRTRRRGTSALVGLLLLATCAAVADDSDPWSAWSSVRYRARASLLTGRVEMEAHAESAETVRFETSAVASFLGMHIAQSRTTTWLDPRTGLPRRHESVSSKRARRYVFGPTSYSVERLVTKGSASEPLERWEVTSREEYDYPKGADGSVTPVFDYYGMLLYLKRLALGKPGDESSLAVATSRGPVVYRIRVAETADEPLTVLDRRADAKRELTIHQLRLRVIPADPEHADEGFLRMEGETEMWVEARTKTLLRVTGKVPKVPGKTKIVLAEIG